MNIFHETKIKALLDEGKRLFRNHRPDMANRLRMEDKNVPLEDVMAQVATLRSQFTDEQLLELVKREGVYYLRYLVLRNIEVKDYLCRAADMLDEVGKLGAMKSGTENPGAEKPGEKQTPQIHMIVIKQQKN